MHQSASVSTPNVALAAEITMKLIGQAPRKVRRFTTGARHYVFQAEFANRPAVVLRIGDRSAHSDMAGAVHLSGVLRPRGVPLPVILAQDIGAEFPWLMLERLAGTDLGAVIDRLSPEQLDKITAKVANAQAVTAKTGSAGRYGYAVLPQQASHATWSQVVEAGIDRSRRRISTAGLFDAGLADIVRHALITMRDQVDRIAPTPFLHDTTTKNVIVAADGEFSGIVDVDDLCFGDARYPAALTLAALMARGCPVHYVCSWLRHARQSDDRVFRLYVTSFLLDLMAEYGHAFNGSNRPLTPEARMALHRAFEGSLRSIEN